MLSLSVVFDVLKQLENINTAADNVSSEQRCAVTEIKKLDAKKKKTRTMTNMRHGQRIQQS